MDEQKAVQGKTIGEFVSEDYRTAAIFEKYGIDFCCGGQQALTAVCREKALDPEILQRELEAAKNQPGGRDQNFGAWELPVLADYIVNTHHSYLNENTGQIADYARKIARVHGSHHPEVIEIATLFDKIAADMSAHLREEEEVFFPMIKRVAAAGKNAFSPAAEDIALLQDTLATLYRDHEEIGDAIHRIRFLSADFTIPEDVCNTFVVTYQRLKEFEDDLHMHVHLENNILFPKSANLSSEA